jgi:hypothetical protein
MDDSGRNHEEDIFEMIRHDSENPEIELDHDDGSQYLNESGEGIEEEAGNVLQLTKSGEVYL